MAAVDVGSRLHVRVADGEWTIGTVDGVEPDLSISVATPNDGERVLIKAGETLFPANDESNVEDLTQLEHLHEQVCRCMPRLLRFM